MSYISKKHVEPCQDCYEPKHKDQEHHCNGCICNQLRKLQPGTEVDVFLSNGNVLEDVLFDYVKSERLLCFLYSSRGCSTRRRAWFNSYCRLSKNRCDPYRSGLMSFHFNLLLTH